MTVGANQSAKRHHYVPRFYLAGFAEADGSLYAHDLDAGTLRAGTTHTEGVAKHFYRVSGADESRVEKRLSEIEGPAAGIIREIESSRDLPCNKNDFETLLFFVALQSQRVIRSAAAVEVWLHAEARRLRGELSPDEERVFQLAREDMVRDGYQVVEPRSLEQLGVHVVDGQLVIDKDMVVAHMLGSAQTVFDNFVKRVWVLAPLGIGVPDLITCDSPVNAVRSNQRGVGAVNVGYHLPNRIVVYPVTRRIGLLGYADGLKRAPVVPGDPQLVGFLNWASLMGAGRFAWSRRPRVYHVAGDGIHNETSYMVSLRKRRRAPYDHDT
jgi:hypothetical protein